MEKPKRIEVEGKLQIVMGKYAYKQLITRIENNVKLKKFYSGKTDNNSLLEVYNQVKTSNLINKDDLCKQIIKINFNPKSNIVIYTQLCTQKK